MKTVREIIFYKDYFEDFFETLAQNEKEKVDEVLFMITILERIPGKFFKSIEGIRGYLKFGLNLKVTFIGCFAVLTKEI